MRHPKPASERTRSSQIPPGVPRVRPGVDPERRSFLYATSKISLIALAALAYAPELVAVECTGTIPQRVTCLTTAVTNLESGVSTNTGNISTNAGNIGLNTADIDTLEMELSNLVPEVEDMIALLEEFFDVLPEEVLDFIETQQPVLEFYVQQELAGLDDFLGPDPGCVEPSECHTFRQNTLELLDLMQDLMVAAATFQQGNPPPDLVLQFTPLQDLVADAPGTALYPLYRALHIGLDQLRNEVGESIDSIEAIRLLNQGDCAEIDANREETREHYERLRRRTPVVKMAGKILTALGKKNVRPLAALWGWTGAEIKVDFKGQIGSVLDGIADSMTLLTERTDSRINHCQLMAAVCQGQAGPGGQRPISQACRDEGF